MIRLDKYLCDSTDLTRAFAKRVIHQSRVTINGVIVKATSTAIKEGDEVCLDGNVLVLRGPRYIMLNKPPGFACSTQEEELPSALNLLEVDKPDTLHFAGRLDADTTGLVLITDDGKWSHRITSPRRACEKRYRAELAEAVSTDLVASFAEGLQLKGEATLTLPSKLEIISSEGETSPDGQVIGKHVYLTLQEGRYHQVKRMFGAVSNRVVSLHRDRIGAIQLDPELEPGEWRYLTPEEVACFKVD